MRQLACLLVLVAAACDPGANEGAVLTFTTPEGPLAATRLEIVLANAATDAISDVANQRHEPGSEASEAVRYYRQRAFGGTIEGSLDLDGYQLRIEPDATISTDERFVPFVFAYAADQLVGIGAIEDDSGDPTFAQITPGALAGYAVTMTRMVENDAADAAIERGAARVVTCAAATTGARWNSGVAWLPHGRQLRLLLPDRARDDGATDATARTADLDCDAHPADASDCDDLRGAFYSGAAETCDGLDTNCDSQRYIAQACNAGGASCPGLPTSGVQICDDESGALGVCRISAECACAQGTATPGCWSCTVDFPGGTAAAKPACSPSIGKIKLPMCEGVGCSVEVTAATNGWRAFISLVETGGFSDKLSDVLGGVYLEVKRGTTLPVTADGIGAIYLRVTMGQVTTSVPILIFMNGDESSCHPTANGNGSVMTCSP